MVARRILMVAALAALGAGAPAQEGRSGRLRVTAVRHWPAGDGIRVAVEVTGEFEYHHERLHNPERLFFDIFRASPSFTGKRVYRQTVDDRLLKGIRVAETLPGVTRIVLDLASEADFDVSQLANPDRLIIDLRAVKAKPAPAAPPPAAPVTPTSTERLPDVAPAAAVTPAIARPEPKPDALKPEGGKPAPQQVPPAPRVSPEPPQRELPATVAKIEKPKAARRTSSGESSLTRTLGLKIARVVLDPGHGGHDQGTSGPKGLLEKDLVLDVAQRLGKLIEERMGSEVIFTRTDDTFIPLERRTEIANERRADLFVSIHANSSPYARIGGVETFYLAMNGTRDAMDVAARENASFDKSVFELRSLIQKIATNDKVEESRELAGRLQSALFANAARINPGIRNRGVKKAPFVVLIGAQMPSVLAEIGFLSNAREEASLRRPEGRQRVAEALYRGLARYADGLSHFQLAAAAKD